jgi:hypothetical protein
VDLTASSTNSLGEDVNLYCVAALHITRDRAPSICRPQLLGDR